jgi:glycosyltransferase involved in cell wall biosynthesis
MLPVTIVIIAKNEAKNIVACILSAKTISDNIVLVDAESQDETANLAEAAGCQVIMHKWRGYGNARNLGAAAGKYDWILSLDADERITPSFMHMLPQAFYNDEGIVYGFKRRNFFAGKELRFGSLGRDKVWRLYNRNVANWDSAPVHEKLTGGFREKKLLKLTIDHFTIEHYTHYKNKSTIYAYLCATKYMQEKRRANIIKRLFAAHFNFVKSYFFLLGFLDGKKGLAVAKVNAYYTWLKYHYLGQLAKESRPITEPDALTLFGTNTPSFLK